MNGFAALDTLKITLYAVALIVKAKYYIATSEEYPVFLEPQCETFKKK